MPTFPRTNDHRLFGLELESDPCRSRFELLPRLARHDGGLYGGTATAVSIVAMEAATERAAVSVTTHYVATAKLGDQIDCTTTVLALGGRVAQTEVTGRVADQVMFVSVGCTAIPREEGLSGQWRSMPAVADPDRSDADWELPRFDEFRGFTEVVEFRPTSLLDGSPMRGLLMWTRIVGGDPVTPAGIAFMADMVPLAIARTAGRLGGGSSLDNSLRFGDVRSVDGWILLEVFGQVSHGAHAVGSLNVWSEDGALLAVGSQVTNMRYLVDAFGPIPG